MKKKEKCDKNDGKCEFKSENNDPLGSYTGTPENPDEVPVQDVDDL